MIDKILSLAPVVRDIICNKSTERPFTGEYESSNTPGTYLCRRCGLALFRAEHKFHSGCGWPSFDQEIPGAVKQLPDKDGHRTEILCARCDAHLGHVFYGEYFTDKNTRHCVNSLSLDFVSDLDVKDTEEAIFAAGCFWGVEYLFQQLPGVLKTEVGYSGGDVSNPSYAEICTKQTGHFEGVRVLFDPTKISYESVVKYFFEIHDPTQSNGQGPDHGEQYLSRIFYFNEDQKRMAEKLMQILRDKGYELETELLSVAIFWRAEAYHQNYYAKTGRSPYCHRYIKRFP
jgi:peptide methionine sulfoxide reductase msrA/msrB